MLTSLPWDSEFFGFGVGRWSSSTASVEDLAALRQEAQRARMRLIYWFAPAAPELEEVARLAGATLVDRKVTFVAGLPEGRIAESEHIARVDQPTDRLRSLALQSGAYSRFKLDGRLPSGAFERMYTLWLERSLTGELAQEVLVFRQGQEEQGFLTLGVKHGRADIGLLAVDSSATGRGIGTALVNAAFGRAAAWGCAQVQVVTQGQNTPACALYARCGFTAESEEHVYHLWL